MSTKRTARREDGFCCVHCRAPVSGVSWGTSNRNHCPRCLWSRHADESIGDRRAACAQPMEPIAVAAKTDGEWAIVHRCVGCGQLRVNRIAGDDDEVVLLALALRPISAPAFPLDSIRAR